MCPLVPTEVGVWERVISALGSTPVCWISTVIRYSLVRYVLAALGFSPIRCLAIALGFSPIRCKGRARYPLVASFLFVLVDVEPCGECSGLWQTLPFVCEDLRSSRLVSWLLCGSGYYGIWDYKFWAICISRASICFTTALTVSTFCSTCDSHHACSSTSLVVECQLFGVCSWTWSLIGAEVSDTWWRVLAISKIIWLRTFDLWVTYFRMTQVGPPSSTKLLSGSVTT